MALSSSVDFSRVDNLETRAEGNEATIADHAASLANKLDKTVTAFQDIPAVNVTATNNALKMTTVVGNTQWLGGMEDPNTYYWALGKFHSNIRDFEIRAYMDNMILRSGRKAGAVAADITLITNDQNTAGISANINLQPGIGGVINQTKAMNGPAYNVTSDIKFKDNVKEWTEKAIDLIRGTKVKSYHYKDDENKSPQIGIIRQEAPEAIHAGTEHINLYSMVSVLWKAVHELTEEIEALKKGATP